MPALDRSRPARMALALFALAGAGVVGVISAGQRRPPRLDEKSPGRHEGPGPVCATGFWGRLRAKCSTMRRPTKKAPRRRGAQLPYRNSVQ